MDKRVVLSVAGSGKTSHIIDKISEDSRCLIVTYTENNTKNIKKRIYEKFGKIPDGVRVYSYFKFLYAFCFRPLCGYELKTKGINFISPLPKYASRTKKTCLSHYIDRGQRLFSNRIAKLLIERNVIPEVIERIEHFYDIVCFDEVQDLAANDFNFLCALAKSDVEFLLVGDFYQHTFDTSRDGATQRALHECFKKYCEKLKAAGFVIDTQSLSHSYRCSPSVCAFAENKLGISIQSHRTDAVVVRHIVNDQDIENTYLDDSIVKLFYQKSSCYGGNSDNWGNAKGLDHFVDVCVVLNPTTMKAYASNTLRELPSTTKNKLYVAITRAKGNLFFIEEKCLLKFKN